MEHVSNGTQAFEEVVPEDAEDGAEPTCFLSTSSSIAIANGVTGKVVIKWLGELKIPTKKEAFQNRQLLLDYVQNVIENKVKPTENFINKFVEKLDDDAIIDKEMKFLNITIPKKGSKAPSASKKKRLIKNFLIDKHYPTHDKVHNQAIRLDLNLSSLKRQPPPDLLSDGALSTSAVESKWSDSSKANKPIKKPPPKKKKKKSKSKKPMKDDPRTEEPVVINTVPKENRELPAGAEINAAITGVNKLQNAFETLEESVVKLSQDHSRLEEGLTREYSAQKQCLDLLLEEDSVGKRALEKRIDQTLQKQLNPLMKRIQHLEATNRSLQEGFELHTKNLECILEKLSTINDIAKNNNTRIDLLHEDLQSTNRRQQEISRKLNLLKPPKTNSTVPGAEVELGALNEHQHDTPYITPCMCRCKNTADRVSSSTQTESTAHVSTEGYQQQKTPVDQPSNQESDSARPVTSGKLNDQMHSATHNEQHDSSALQNDREPRTNRQRDDENAYRETYRRSNFNSKTPNHQQNRSENRTGDTSRPNRSKLTKPAERSEIVPVENRNDQMRRKKCLLVHDKVFSDFDPLRFSREFDVTTYQSGSLNALHKDNRFKNKVQTSNPECIFIHVGLKDVLDGRGGNHIRKSLEDLIWYLLEHSKAKICVSHVIPTKNSDALNQKISEANRIVKEVVDEARSYKPVHKTCLFSYSNNSVDHQCVFTQASKDVTLTEPGKLIMWTRLNDGLRKTLRLPRRQLRDRSHRERVDGAERTNNRNTHHNE